MTSASTTLRILTALLWKESRASRHLLVLLVGSGLLVIGAGWLSAAVKDVRTAREIQAASEWLFVLLPPVAAMLLGANAFAGDRARGTRSYMEALPGNRFTKAAATVAFNLLFLLAYNAALRMGSGPSPRVLREIPAELSFWPFALAAQSLLFGLCLLCSALVDRPLRALLTAPVVVFFAAGPFLCMASGLYVLALAHAPEVRPDSVFCLDSLFDVAVIVAAFLLLGIPFLIEEWQTRHRRGARLALLCALPLPLMLLPAIQFYRLWDLQILDVAVKNFPLGPHTAIAAAGVCGLFMLCSALALEARDWLGRGIRTGWAGAGAIGWTAGGTLLAGWLGVALGFGGRFEVQISYTDTMQSSPDGKQVRVGDGTTLKLGNWLDEFGWRTQSILLQAEGNEAIALPGRSALGMCWSRDARVVAWTESDMGILHRRNRLAVLDLQSAKLRYLSPTGARSYLQGVWPAKGARYVLAATDGWWYTDADQWPVFRFFEVSVGSGPWKSKLLTDWTPVPSGDEWYRPTPIVVYLDGRDIVTFMVPMERDLRRARPGPRPGPPPADRSPYGLYRINLETGRGTLDPAFEELSRTVRELHGSDHVYFRCRRHLTPGTASHRTLVSVSGYREEHVNKPWAQTWRLGPENGTNELLAEDTAYAPIPLVFLDEKTVVFGRSGDTGARGVYNCQIVKRDTATGTEAVLLTLPRADPFTSLDACANGRWLAVRAHQQGVEDPRAWSTTDWLLSADGSFCEQIEFRNVQPSPNSRGELKWIGDSALLRHGKDGLYVIKPVRQNGRAFCDVRRVLASTQLPRFNSLTMAPPTDKGKVIVLTEEYGSHESRERHVYRVDLTTGQPELLLRFVGGRWVGTQAITIRQIEEE